MASLLGWLGKKTRATVAQLNPLDDGRTYSTVMNQGADYTPKAPSSVGQQLTHNGLTNVVGNVIKPVARFPINYANAAGNLGRQAAGARPITPQQQFSDPLTSSITRISGATGRNRELLGDAINIGVSAFAPGTSKFLEQGVARLAPQLPRVIPAAVGMAGAGIPTGAAAGVATTLAGNQSLNPQSIATGAAQGAAFGAVGGAALPLIGAGAKAAAPIIKQGAQKTTQAIQRADQKAFTPRVNLEEQRALQDMSDYLVGVNKGNGQELSQTISRAREAAQRQGVDITSGPRAQQLEAVNSVLDRVGQGNRAVAQGGYLRLPGNEEVNTPLYHGSNAEGIEAFDLSKASRLPGRNLLGKGVYATDSIQRAEKYGRNVYRVDVPTKAAIVDLEAKGQWADPERILGLQEELTKLGVPSRLDSDGTLNTQVGRIDGGNPDSIYRAIDNSRRFGVIGKLEQALDNIGINGLESGDARVLFNASSARPSSNRAVAQVGYIRPPLRSDAEENVFKQNPMVSGNQPKLVGKDAGVAQPDLPTLKTRREGNLSKAFRSTRSVIERQGESGKQLGGMLQQGRDTQELFLASIQKQLPTVRKLKGDKFENFVEATQGLTKPMNAKVAQAVQEWQAVHPSIRERAVNAGLDVGDLGQTYYPHFIDYDRVFKDRNTYNEAINHLVKTGQAPTQEEAIKLLGYARDVSRNRQFGNLEAARLVDLPFYDKTPNSLISYLSGSAKRIAQTETFGAKDEKALNLIKNIGLEGGDTEAAKNAYDVAVGAKQYNPTTSKISQNIRRYVTTTRLGLGALTNVSQNVNTGIVTGHMRTLASAFKQLSPKTRAFVGDTGVIADAVLNDIRTQSGYASFGQRAAGKVVDKITAPFFGTVEKLNRSISATAGRDYGLRLAQRGDQKTLRRLGVTGDIKDRTLTEAQQIQVARKVVEKTQFKVDPQDLPGWTDTPGGKLVAQFRTFSYNQGKFVSNEILKPAAKGNLMPLGRLLAALPLGYALYETKRVIAGRPEEENKNKVGLAAFQNVGGAGLAFDLYQSLNPLGSKYIPSDRRVSMAFGAAGGPAIGVAAQGSGAISEAIQRKNTPKDESRLAGKVVAAKNANDYTDLTPLARFGLQQVPIIGTPIKNRLLPFKKESNADAGKVAAFGDSQAKTDFKNSGESIRTDGDVVYRRSSNGVVRSVPKTKYDYDVAKATLTQQKKAGDISAWLDTANKQVGNISRQLKDPTIDQLDKLRLQNESVALQGSINKYKSYGGFTRPKSTKSKRVGSRKSASRRTRGALTTSFKTARTLRSPSLPRVSVRKPGSFKAPSVRKLSVSKIPTNLNKRKQTA